MTLFRLKTSGFEVELFTDVGSGRYVALGLSEDSSMGEDLVIMCGSVSDIKLPNYFDSNSLAVQATQAELVWNNGKTPEVLSGVTGIREYRVTQSDGAKLCRIQTEEILGAGDKTRDLNRDHHLLLAGGPYSAGSLGYHVGNKVIVSHDKIPSFDL